MLDGTGADESSKKLQLCAPVIYGQEAIKRYLM